MKATNKIEIKFENFDKCHVTIDVDCSLGQMYDFSCQLKHYVGLKILEAEKSEQQKQEDEQKAV